MDELSKRFADLVAQYGPGVVEAAKAAIQTEIYSCLVGSLIAFGVSGALLLGGRWLMKHETKDEFDAEIPYVFGCILTAISVIPLFIGLWQWIDPWTWTALTHPEIYMAYRILKI